MTTTSEAMKAAGAASKAAHEREAKLEAEIERLRAALMGMDRWVKIYGGPSFDKMPCVKKMRAALNRD